MLCMQDLVAGAIGRSTCWNTLHIRIYNNDELFMNEH